jgi:ABC-type uncharacterized transport system substrate-binding protein
VGRGLRAALVVSLGLLPGLLPGLACAHPHVFVDNRVTFLFDGSRLTGFRENWLFDEVFSDQLLQDFDTNHDGQFSKAESDKVGTETLPNLAQFRYFTYVWVGGKDVGKIVPTDFRASAHDKLVTFDFLVKLPRPVDPRREDFAVEINDREYYVQVLLAKGTPITFQGMRGISCQPTVRKDVKNAYYGGFVYPQQIKLKCQ